MLTIERRIAALEALPFTVDDEGGLKFKAALSALLDAVNTRSDYERSTVAPFDLEQQPSKMDALWKRIEAGTTTEADRAILAALPACHVSPEMLVEAVVKLREKKF